ncbi:MAG TPA: hypothetical protein DIW37_10815 [Chryseobacterium sp.]|nr:hypothetical protein [Chryseobacterium sp.]
MTMTKKMISWLSFMTVFIFLYSCQQEVLQNEQEASLQSQHLTVRRLKIEQLQQKYSPVLEKINQLESYKVSSNGRIYTDAENGFSIDTERAFYIEDDKRNKTYTFTINRTNPNPSLYESLVLKDRGSNTFSAYIISYKKTLFQLSATPSDEELNNYIGIEDLGRKSRADIFGKTLVCYKTFTQNTYVPGTPCVNGHTDPAVCDLHGDAAPIPGYWISGYTVMPYLCDNNPDPVITIPLEGGGGGWNGSMPPPIELFTPCEFVKGYFDDPCFLNQYNSLNNPANFDKDHEVGFYEKVSNINGSQVQSFTPVNGESCSRQLDLPQVRTGITGLGHTHNNYGCDGKENIKVPSAEDIMVFLFILVKQSYNFYGSYAPSYYLTTTSEGNYLLHYSGTVHPSNLSFDINVLRNKYKDIFDRLKVQDANMPQDKVEEKFAKFLKENVNINGLELYKVTPTSSEKLEYNPITKKLDKIPCP